MDRDATQPARGSRFPDTVQSETATGSDVSPADVHAL